ncbi:MAG: hypothetical protein AB8B49_00555 [Nitratireductor sp.]
MRNRSLNASKQLHKIVFAALSSSVLFGLPLAHAADAPSAPSVNMIDSTPIAEQRPAVDGWNYKAGVVSGVIGGHSNHMFIGSVALPMPLYSEFGIQLDLGIGSYRSEYTSAASALHIFYRDPDSGLVGIYGDWGYVDNEHGGRVGVELSKYQGRWSIDVMAGVRFGQHFLTDFDNEVDLSYYFTDNLKGSIGHRYTARGHVANAGFEYAPTNNGWSVYGEAEIGQDNYDAAWAGIRYSFGSSAGKSLIERDRQSDPIVRIPRNLASITRCGDTANGHESWNGFETSTTTNLCGSKDDLDRYGAVESKANSD